jgi:hypothetical protein
MYAKFGKQLAECHRPHVGQCVTWALILVAVTQTSSRLPATSGERTGPVSVLSFLPDEIVAEPSLLLAARLALVAAGGLWALHLLLPYSSWLTAVLFTVVVALFNENSSRISHVFHLANLVMIVHALWFHFHWREIKRRLTPRKV